MPTYITEWDGTRNALIEVVGGDGFLEAITETATLVNLGDTLIDGPADVTSSVNTSPVTATGTPTVVLF